MRRYSRCKARGCGAIVTGFAVAKVEVVDSPMLQHQHSNISMSVKTNMQMWACCADLATEIGPWLRTNYDADGAPDETAEFDRHVIRIFLCADFRADSSHFNLIRLQEINRQSVSERTGVKC